MTVFVCRVPVFSGGKVSKSVVKVCADNLEDWEELVGLLEYKGRGWVVQPRGNVPADWTPNSRMLPYAKVRVEDRKWLDDLECPVVDVPAGYVEWAQQTLKRKLCGQKGPESGPAFQYNERKLREIGFRLMKNGLLEDLEREFPDARQRSAIKIVNDAVENLDLGNRRRLKLERIAPETGLDA